MKKLAKVMSKEMMETIKDENAIIVRFRDGYMEKMGRGILNVSNNNYYKYYKISKNFKGYKDFNFDTFIMYINQLLIEKGFDTFKTYKTLRTVEINDEYPITNKDEPYYIDFLTFITDENIEKMKGWKYFGSYEKKIFKKLIKDYKTYNNIIEYDDINKINL